MWYFKSFKCYYTYFVSFQLTFEPKIRSAKLQERRRAQILNSKKSKPKKAKKSTKAPSKK